MNITRTGGLPFVFRFQLFSKKTSEPTRTEPEKSKCSVSKYAPNEALQCYFNKSFLYSCLEITIPNRPPNETPWEISVLNQKLPSLHNKSRAPYAVMNVKTRPC
jgi:hypothetical protein